MQAEDGVATKRPLMAGSRRVGNDPEPPVACRRIVVLRGLTFLRARER